MDALVRRLARELGVRVIYDPDYLDTGSGGAGEDEEGDPFIILARTPKSEIPGLTALHELGHHATRWGPQGGDNWTNKRRIDMEVAAWEWALDHTPQPLTEDGLRYILEALGAYVLARRYRVTRRATNFYLELQQQLLNLDTNGGYTCE